MSDSGEHEERDGGRGRTGKSEEANKTRRRGEIKKTLGKMKLLKRSQTAHTEKQNLLEK